MADVAHFQYAKTRHETSRSFKTKSVQKILKPFSTMIIKPRTAYPAGSPELKPNSSIYGYCNVVRRKVESINVYDINIRSLSTEKGVVGDKTHGVTSAAMHARVAGTEMPPDDMLDLNPTKSHLGENIVSNDFAHNFKGRLRRKHVFYFSGGGWQSVPSSEHWKFCAEMATRSPATTVTLISYPLAPNSSASTSIAQLVKLYLALIPPFEEQQSGSPDSNSLKRVTTSQHPEDEDDIILAGDSAGANIALALTLHVLSTIPNARPPASLLLISPVVDLRHVNPVLGEVAKNDPILTLPFVQAMAKAWTGADLAPTDPLVSPIFGDFSLLAKHRVSVNGVIAGYDLLSPDGIELRKKCEENGIHGVWLHWEKMMHCFPIAFSHGLTESVTAMNWVLTVLKSISNLAGKSS